MICYFFSEMSESRFIIRKNQVFSILSEENFGQRLGVRSWCAEKIPTQNQGVYIKAFVRHEPLDSHIKCNA